MKAYIKAWEKSVVAKLEKDQISREDLMIHNEKIQWLQHERLVHLLVMLFVLLCTLIVFIITMYRTNGFLWYLLFSILMILGLFYIRHYYLLENTVQRWYHISDKIRWALVRTDQKL